MLIRLMRKLMYRSNDYRFDIDQVIDLPASYKSDSAVFLSKLRYSVSRYCFYECMKQTNKIKTFLSNSGLMTDKAAFTIIRLSTSYRYEAG